MLLLHLPLMRLHPCPFVLEGCFIRYINPLKKGLSSITKMGEIESAWLIPCMVLVINDNLYGLMFALSYICRCCPYALLDLHMLESRLRKEERRLYVDQGYVQVDQHTRLGMYHEGSCDLMVW